MAKLSSWSDQRVDNIIGNLLRTGVVIAAVVVLAGGVAYVVQQAHTTVHWGVFRGEPADLRSVPAIVQEATALHSRGIIQLGLLLLIATPVARVAFSVIAFALQRDHTYVIITLIVFATLLYSLMGQ
jgi:uncharacterized membrane protein